MTDHYQHADCDKAIIEERLDDACEDCRNHMFKPPTPPDDLENTAKGTPFDGMFEGNQLKTPPDQPEDAALFLDRENVREAYMVAMAMSSFEQLIDVLWKEINERLQATQPPAADTTKQEEGESDED